MIEIILSTITFFLNSLFGLFVFYRNTKSCTNRLFFVLTILINIYIVVNYFSLHPPVPSPENQLFWIRLVMFVCSFIGPALFLLVHTFPKDKIQMRLSRLVILIILCIASASASLSPFLFTSISYPGGKPMPNPGPAIPIFFIDFVGLFFFSFILLIYKYRKSQGLEKIQHYLFLLGIITTFTVMATTTVIFVVILKLSDFVFLGPISALFLVAFVAYAIIKHRFLDVRLILARTVAYVLLVLVLGGIYSLSFFTVGSIIFSVPFSITQFLIYGTISLIIVFTFQYPQNFIEKLTDSIFYKGHYDSQELLKSLSAIMSTTIELKDLTSRILEATIKEIRITSGAFALLEKKQKNYIDYVDWKGYGKLPIFNADDVKKLLERNTIIIFDELEDGAQKELMRKLNVAVVLPLIVQEENIGILLFGAKASGEIYSETDIDLFEILAPQLSIAIQNAKEYEEIKRFNITLKDEVNKATKDLQDANLKLQQLDKLKDEFVSLASHELRTPMTAIKSYLWMALAGKGGKLSEKQSYYLDRAYKSTDRLIKLVNDMLDVSRIESGRISITLASVDLKKLIEDTIEELQPRTSELNVNIINSVTQKLPLVYADSDKLKEVFINLLGNSLKFTPVDGSITISTRVDNGMVIADIHDTGAGIKKEDLPKLFQKFGIVGNEYFRKQNSQGTGLGLYISKSLIELQGGKIWVDSKGEGKGTTFSFSLKPYAGHMESINSNEVGVKPEAMLHS